MDYLKCYQFNEQNPLELVVNLLLLLLIYFLFIIFL